jgi:hypothetical protein
VWWFLAVGAAFALLFACALYAELGPGAGKKVRAREASTNTNYAVIQAISNGRRNQTSGQ